MQALILAAGMGNRLGNLTKENTKCMVRVNGQRLIDRILNSLVENKIERICIVVGYKKENLQEHVGLNWKGVPIVYIVNEEFFTTNNIYSLFLAREFFGADNTILIESDLIVRDNVLTNLITSPQENVVLAGKYTSGMDGTVVTADHLGRITQFLRKSEFTHRDAERYFKTVNIYKFSKEFITKSYLPFLNAYCESQGNNQYYEEVLRIISHLHTDELHMLEINNRDWYEIDDQHDLANASLIFAAEKDEYEAFISRFGGYWRFPYVKDYSLLVNPYFPTIDFIQELESEFRTLLTNYPSSRSVIEALAAGYFAISPQEIVVGNGASELTTALGIEWNEETIGLFRPTYEEYSQRFKNVVTAQSSNFIKALTKNEILELAKRVKIICLVNPENPTGQYIPYLDLLDIVKELHERNIKLIIDESFIDFSYEGTKASMINREIIAKFPNLYVIKSISKSYGVPGIRLGVLVSSNTSSLNKIRASLPIWNINSMAEAFLQKINKYRKQYEIALANFRDARVFFETGLQNLGFKVIPSNANYILCSPIESISSGEFARQILHEGYLIKDLNSKPGMQGTNFIRIAIRSLEENKEFLLAAKRVINSQDQSNSS